MREREERGRKERGAVGADVDGGFFVDPGPGWEEQRRIRLWVSYFAQLDLFSLFDIKFSAVSESPYAAASREERKDVTYCTPRWIEIRDAPILSK